MTRWHLLHLPVWIRGQSKPWTLVQEVLFQWPEPPLLGLVVFPNWWSVALIRVQPGVAVTATGVTLEDRRLAEMKNRSWWKVQQRASGNTSQRPIFTQQGKPFGIIKDVIFDETSMELRGFVISRGLLQDLWQGTVVVSLGQVTEDNEGRMKL